MKKKKGFEVRALIKCVEEGAPSVPVEFSHTGSRADILKEFRKALAKSAGEKVL